MSELKPRWHPSIIAMANAMQEKLDAKGEQKMNTVIANIEEKDLVKQMVDRFLRWRLPEDFSPDAGISFKAEYNENTPYPMRHEPVGTNLFDAEQAEQMVRHMLGLSA